MGVINDELFSVIEKCSKLKLSFEEKQKFYEEFEEFYKLLTELNSIVIK